MANELDLTFQGAGTLYAIIRRVADLFVWNGTAFVAFVNGDVASYDVALTSGGGDYFAADFPAAIGAGSYRVTYYEQSGGTPAITDLLLDTEEFYWSGTAVAPSPVSGITVFCVRADVEQKVGPDNLEVYADLDNDENAASITAAITDDIVEAAVDMHTAWRQYDAIALDSFTDIETRWLADTNAYGAAVKAYYGRTIDDGGPVIENDDDNDAKLPAQVGAAKREWRARLSMLRDGTALLDYQSEEGIDAATTLGIPSVAKSDGTAVEASDLPYLCPSPPRPYVWP